MFTVGRPRKYQTKDELIKVLDQYFNDTPIEEWTVTGLGLEIGLDRKALIEYGKQDEFSYTIKKAKQMIEYSYELALRKKGDSGSIFGLKNFGWADKQVQEVEVKTSKLDGVLRQLDEE